MITDTIFGLERHSRVASCFFRVFFCFQDLWSLDTHSLPPPPLLLFSLLHSSRPFKADAKSQSIVLDDAGHPSPPIPNALSHQSLHLRSLPQTRSPSLALHRAPLHPSLFPLYPPLLVPPLLFFAPSFAPLVSYLYLL